MNPPKKIYFNGFVGNLVETFGYYIFNEAADAHFMVCHSLREYCFEKTDMTFWEIIEKINVSESNVQYLYRENFFPMFIDLDDLRKFVDYLQNAGVLLTQDFVERKALGLKNE